MATTDISIIKIRNLPDVSLVSETDEVIIQSSVDTGKTLISKFITDLDLMKSATITGTSGASSIGTHSGATVQQYLDSINNGLSGLLGNFYFSPFGNEIGSNLSDFSVSPSTRGYGVRISESLSSFSPKTDNTLSNGTPTLRWSQLYAVNSTVATSNKLKKKNLRQITPAETRAFYEIGHLDSVWQWIERYRVEGDNARLHSGPTVQDAIKVMLKHGLDWTKYSAFCYDKWEETEDTPAGEEYGFRKEELLFWILRATIATQDSIMERLEALESHTK